MIYYQGNRVTAGKGCFNQVPNGLNLVLVYVLHVPFATIGLHLMGSCFTIVTSVKNMFDV